ncbi:PREDICTED: protein aveugle-like isoform X2 [Eufriesea mexicana]|uniref:protein aveugle-like isoform X2 n=1 Tax=Eufriesea mexicana TaxID=516756 RepID=UPI00083BD318|nr:PREDICTED: protein aveugle-like isoform X2 [Eufriesea mexicana]
MVEEVVNSTSKPKNKTARPRPVYLWNVLDVQKWLRRHCSDYYQLYHERFLYLQSTSCATEILEKEETIHRSHTDSPNVVLAATFSVRRNML